MQGAYRWFWRVLPGNPVVVRIVQGGSMRQRDLWIRMGYLGALIGLILIGLIYGGGVGGETGLNELAKSGTWVFTFIAYGQVVLICLLAPLFMASAIAAEQSGKTYDILLTTPLSNLQIVLGSLVGRLFFVIALLLSGLPLFAMLLIFGGVPVYSVYVAFTVAALTALFVGSVAVTLSVMRAGGRKAVFAFVIGIAGYLVAAYALDAVLLRQLSSIPKSTTWLTPLHPLLVLEASLNSANYRPPPPEVLADYPGVLAFYLGSPFIVFAILSLLGSLVMLTWCAIVLRNIGQGESKFVIWLKTKLRMGDAGGERVHAARTVSHNPIAWRESHTRGKVASGIIARWSFFVLGLLLGGLLLLLYHLDGFPPIRDAATGQPLSSAQILHQGLSVILMIEVAIITLVALYMSAGCVSKEREDGTLDLMLTTPITPRQYVWGKLRGLVRFLALLIAVPVLTMAMVAIYTVIAWATDSPKATFDYRGVASDGSPIVLKPMLMLPEAPVLMLLMLVPFVAFCVAIGMGASLKAKGVLGAVIPSVAIIGVLSLLFGFCGWMMAASVPLLGPIVNAASPTTNMFMLIDPWDRVSGFAENSIANRIILVIAATLAAVTYGMIVYGFVITMVKNFDTTVRKLSGTG